MLDHIVREDGHKVEEVYNIPSSNRSSQQDFGVTFEEIQLEASKELG